MLFRIIRVFFFFVVRIIGKFTPLPRDLDSHVVEIDSGIPSLRVYSSFVQLRGNGQPNFVTRLHGRV